MQRKVAENVLKKLQEAPDAWTRVDGILEHSQNQQTKFFALQATPSHASPVTLALHAPSSSIRYQLCV